MAGEKLVKKALDFLRANPELKPYKGGSFSLERQGVYNPKYFDLKKDDLVDEAGNIIASKDVTIPREGFSYDLPAQADPSKIFRGMSAEEFANFQKNNYLQSLGTHNIGEGQKGLTYFSVNPDEARSYAHSFAPSEFKPDPSRPAYVVAAKRPPDESISHVPGTGESEVGVMGQIPREDVTNVYRGNVVDYIEGIHEPGARVSPSSSVHWEEINDYARGGHIDAGRNHFAGGGMTQDEINAVLSRLQFSEPEAEAPRSRLSEVSLSRPRIDEGLPVSFSPSRGNIAPMASGAMSVMPSATGRVSVPAFGGELSAQGGYLPIRGAPPMTHHGFSFEKRFAHGGEVEAALHAVRHHLAGGGFLSDLFSGPDYLSTGKEASFANMPTQNETNADFFKADKALRLAREVQAADDVTGSMPARAPLTAPRPGPVEVQELPVSIPFAAPERGASLLSSDISPASVTSLPLAYSPEAPATPAAAAIDQATGKLTARVPQDVEPTTSNAQILAAIRANESRNNPRAQNPTSSAGGLYQFLNSTWGNTLRRMDPERFGAYSDRQLRGLKTDPNAVDIQHAAANYHLTNDIAPRLSKAGVPLTPGSAYLSWFQGPGGAVRAYTAPDDATVAQVFPKTVSANANMRFNGKPYAQWTMSDLRQWADTAMAKRMGRAEGGEVEGYDKGGIIKKALRAVENYKDPAAYKIADWKWRPLADVDADLGLTEIPPHVQAFGDYMRGMSDKAAGEGLTARDLIKGYTTTRASIQRRATDADRLRQLGLDLPDDVKMIRPEGAWAEWLGTPMGQRYLDAAARGDVEGDAVANAIKVMSPFGRHETDIPDSMKWAAQNLPGREATASDLVARAAQGASAPEEWRQFTSDIRGVGPSKSGFLASLYGRGDQPTLDARQIILNTGEPTKLAAPFLARSKGEGGVEAVDRLAARQSALGLQVPSQYDPFYQHLAHHSIWDKASNEMTTHGDVVKAMQDYAHGGLVDDALHVVREHHADGEAVGPTEEPRPLTIYRGNAPVADEAGGSGREPAPAPPAFSYMPMPESVERQAARQPAYNPAERTWSDAGSTEGERLTRALGVEGELPKGETFMSAAPTGYDKYMPQRRPGTFLKRWGEAFNENADAVEEGLKAVRAGNYGAGALGMVGGGLGMAISPLTGMERVLVRDPYLRITGNLKDAQAAEMVADTALTGGLRGMVKPFAKAGNLEKLAAEPVTSAYRLPSPAATGAATAAGAMLAPDEAEASKLSKLLRVVSPEDRLMLVHNLKSHRLGDIEKLGGLPVPSTAVIKPEQGFTNFGDITMIAPKEMAQPSRTNPIFASDVYSPRFPSVDEDLGMIFIGYTPSGKRRYVPLTLENVVKEMKGNIRGGEGFNYGVGTIRSGVAPQFKSIEQIQNARDLIQPREALQPMFDVADKKFTELADKYYPHYKYSGEEWRHQNDLADMLREAGMGKWYELFNAHKSTTPSELRQEATDFLNYLKQLPTEYFEGKPQRAVRLDEFRGAVVPGDIAGEQADILRRMGVERLEQYDPNNPASRIEALQKFGGEQFAKGGSVEDRALMLISKQA